MAGSPVDSRMQRDARHSFSRRTLLAAAGWLGAGAAALGLSSPRHAEGASV